MSIFAIATDLPPLPHDPLEPLNPSFWETYRVWLVAALLLFAAGGAALLARRHTRVVAPAKDPVEEAIQKIEASLALSDGALADAIVAALRVGLRFSHGVHAERTTADLKADLALRGHLSEACHDELGELLERCDAVRFRPGSLAGGERHELAQRAITWLRQAQRVEVRSTDGPPERLIKEPTVAS